MIILRGKFPEHSVISYVHVATAAGFNPTSENLRKKFLSFSPAPN
jgi:hypothetical protein